MYIRCITRGSSSLSELLLVPADLDQICQVSTNEMAKSPQLLRHTESSETIIIDASGCPGAAAQELRQFEYTRHYQPPDGDRLPAREGCQCKGQCSSEDCVCAAEWSRGVAALQAHGRSAGVVSLLECGPACSCDTQCLARTTQQGLAVHVGLQWSSNKGWCVHAAQPIPQGAFVCHYVGEYVTAEAARRRLAAYDQGPDKGHALLTVRLQLPSQSTSLMCCIDATKQGNIARFINHSCDGGNLEAVLVTIRGCLLPRVGLFAARDIQPGEELTYAYCQAAAADASAAGGCSSRRPCHCGTAPCTGYLPSVL